MNINLETRTVIDGKRALIKNGKPVGDYQIPTDVIRIDDIERLYAEYKTSVPNGIKYRRPYFRALSADKLPTENLISGANRQQAKDKLEFTLLIGILNGSLVWPDETKWFWQSPNDKNLILLRDWFIPERNSNEREYQPAECQQ